MSTVTDPQALLDLADWRRRVGDLYRINGPDALTRFRKGRDELFRTHPLELLDAATLRPEFDAVLDQVLTAGSARGVAEGLEDRSHPATSLLNRKVIKDLLARPLGTTSSVRERAGLERARSVSAWMKDYGVVLDL